MPLLVHCPNNCQIRLPSNRMGKVVRCVECQTPIRIPELDSPLLRTGNWVECRAKRAIKKTDQSNTGEVTIQSPLPSLPIQADRAPTNSETTSAVPLTPPRQNARLLRAKPWRTVEPLTSVDPEACLTPIDLELTPASASPTPAMPIQVQERSATNFEFSAEQPSIGNAADGWLSKIRKLLWYETSAAEEPPPSA